MLGGGRQAVGCREVRALKAAHLGFCEPRGEPRVLAGTLGDPAPARVARHVQHRRVGHGEPVGGRLRRRDPSRPLPQVRVERPHLGERQREDGAVAMNDIHDEEQRNAEAGLLERDPLYLAGPLRAPQIADRADPSGADGLQIVDRPAGAGDGLPRRDQGHLADLLLEGHRGQERFDARRRVGCWHTKGAPASSLSAAGGAVSRSARRRLVRLG